MAFSFNFKFGAEEPPPPPTPAPPAQEPLEAEKPSCARFLRLDDRAKAIDAQYPSMSLIAGKETFHCIDPERIALTPELQAALNSGGAVTDLVHGVYEGGFKVTIP